MVPVPVKLVSFTTGFVRVTFPMLVTRNEYVTVCPAAVTVVGSADFTSEIAGAGISGMVTEEGSDGTDVFEPVGVPSTTAVFVTWPAFTSAWVCV
jgi:hypothetical protein